METLTKASFGEQCADFVAGDEPFFDCYDTFERDFTLQKLNTKIIGAPLDKKEYPLETVLTRETTRKDIKVDDHIPKDPAGSTWFRIFWDKTTHIKDKDWE